MVVRSDGVQNRLQRTGTNRADVVRALGGSGIAAKCVGIDTDLRRDEPYAAYGDLEVSPVSAAAGDVLARFNVRAQEAQVSLRLIREALAELPPGPARPPVPGRGGRSVRPGRRGRTAWHLVAVAPRG